jgi:hypothetical protein
MRKEDEEYLQEIAEETEAEETEVEVTLLLG